MKRIQQLSVFLENKSGRLNEILEILGTESINIIAASVADTSEFGILRMITSDTSKAVEVLKGAGLSANLSEVLALKCENSAASYAQELGKLSNEDIHIEYMYSFSNQDCSTLIVRTNNNAKAIEAAQKYGLATLTQCELNEI
ncbi:MAG: acetolactate synthase [Rikenellaceae bacterium]